jgi:dihydroorotate dehydrogenase
MMYSRLIRPLLFRLDPESAHQLTFRLLKVATSTRLPLAILRRCFSEGCREPVRLWDLEFPNRIGLAAGMDKDGEVIDAMFAMGFGSLELGTVTPVAQSGNPKPRLFRYPGTHAVVNRMGFNNAGVDALAEKVRAYRNLHRPGGVIGINLGKQKSTPIESAVVDYLHGFRVVADLADYVAVNISSPNTENLRKLQDREHLEILLKEMRAANRIRVDQGLRHVPMLLKIAPDLSEPQLETMTGLVLEYGWDGIIATNTTIDRSGPFASYESPGGLSGQPLKDKSTAVLRLVSRITGGKLPLIGVGGIETGADAAEKLDAGASLVQVYSGFIYQGPGMVRAIVRDLKSRPVRG